MYYLKYIFVNIQVYIYCSKYIYMYIKFEFDHFVYEIHVNKVLNHALCFINRKWKL